MTNKFHLYQDKIPRYEIFARDARQWASSRSAARPEESMRQLQGATRDVIESFYRQLDVIPELQSSIADIAAEMRRLREDIEKLREHQDVVGNQIRRNQQQQQDNNNEQQQQQNEERQEQEQNGKSRCAG